STSYGVVITGKGNVLFGNSIGIDASGAAVGNGVGVLLAGTGNVIGDVSPGLGNKIAYSAGFGVAVRFDDSAGNTIRGNSIHDKDGLGIGLGLDGVTPNDPGDADMGSNNLQNFPAITPQHGGPTTAVSGTLDTTASQSFTIDFYASGAADPSGYGEG